MLKNVLFEELMGDGIMAAYCTNHILLLPVSPFTASSVSFNIRDDSNFAVSLEEHKSLLLEGGRCPSRGEPLAARRLCSRMRALFSLKHAAP